MRSCRAVGSCIKRKSPPGLNLSSRLGRVAAALPSSAVDESTTRTDCLHLLQHQLFDVVVEMGAAMLVTLPRGGVAAPSTMLPLVSQSDASDEASKLSHLPLVVSQ